MELMPCPGIAIAADSGSIVDQEMLHSSLSQPRSEVWLYALPSGQQVHKMLRRTQAGHCTQQCHTPAAHSQQRLPFRQQQLHRDCPGQKFWQAHISSGRQMAATACVVMIFTKERSICAGSSDCTVTLRMS